KALQTRMQVHDKKTNYRIAPNLVRTDIFTPCESFKTDPDVQRQIRMISVCSAQRVKRHDIMFKTLKELIDRGWNAKLTLYGVDEFNLPLVHQREELGLSDKIEFLGRADKQTLHGAFCRHDVYLCTSELETFGLAPAEAISSGLIVVSSDCGGVNEFLNEDNGILVHQPDTKNFADAVEMVAGKTRTTVSAWQSIHSRYGEEAFKNYWSKLYTEILTTWDSSLN
ncbi:MAG TPA: glycosyltransferase, partial [Ohtaekwangia sp.]